MATRNIVPRANNEGEIGTSSKRWNHIHTTNLRLNGTDIVVGNSSGEIPFNNNRLNTGLNADMLDGLHLSSMFDYNGTAWYDNAGHHVGYAFRIYDNGTYRYVPTYTSPAGVCHSNCHGNCHSNCHTFQ